MIQAATMLKGLNITKRRSRLSTIGKLRGKGVYLIALNCLAIVCLLSYHKQLGLLNKRTLSADLGNGNCLWEHAQPMGADVDSFGTLIASYPASGMRVTWQHAEGLTGIQVGDDFRLGGDGVEEKTGLMKTQYPHKEGTWSWAGDMSQAILLVRNPRWALPSFHALLSEIHFAVDRETAFLFIQRTFSTRPLVEEWINWRDYRFEEEIKLWRWHIDFWMEGGTQYWIDDDFERCGQHPFNYRDETDRANWPRDPHCTDDMDCEAKAVVSYETLKDSKTGPSELKKVAQLVRGKEGFTEVVGDDAIQCVWEGTNTNNPSPAEAGPPEEKFTFTTDQLATMKENIQFMINKYGSGYWETNPLAQDLIKYFNSYIDEVTVELEGLLANPPPTPPFDPNREAGLIEWYNTLGRGNRYSLFTDEAEVANPITPLTEKEAEWLSVHNTRRRTYQESYDNTKPYVPLKWSNDLANSAQEYAQLLIDELPCQLQHGYKGNSYGGENLALSGGTSPDHAEIDSIMTHWADDEANIGFDGNSHFRQVVWRATEYVGCGQASKAHAFSAFTGYCHVMVCRYLRPGNCDLTSDNWEEKTYADTSPCGPTCPSEGCYDGAGSSLPQLSTSTNAAPNNADNTPSTTVIAPISVNSAEWLRGHNTRRQTYQESYDNTKPYVPLKWSNDLANSAQEYAQLLIDELPCQIQHGYKGNSYGGENLALNGGSSPDHAEIDSIMTRWTEDEANLPYAENGHFRQAIWRATEYVGCGQASKVHTFTRGTGYCHVQACRYLRPGNCAVSSDNWEEKMYADTSPCGPTCPSEGCT